jgi:carbamoyltransferase
MRILAIHPGFHDAAAAAFDDYRLLAAVEDERLTRRKGSGDPGPWAAIDEALRIAGWSRQDVDAIASTRAFFASHCLRHPLWRELDFAWRRWRGEELRRRELFVASRQAGTTGSLAVFRAKTFLAENGFRPDVELTFANHHEAHALPTLFFTDWDEALLYTADGVGDNVSYSVRVFRDGRIDCAFGDDRFMLGRRPWSSVAVAYGTATEMCGFKRFRHEGKLTGLAAWGEPTHAAELAALFRIGDGGVVEADFPKERDLEAAVRRILDGQTRETIAASIQKATEDVILASVGRCLGRAGARRLGLAGGLFANVRLNRLLAESLPLDEVFVFPAMGDAGLPVGAGLAHLLRRDGLAQWLTHRRRLEDVYLGQDYDGAIDRHLAAEPRVKRLPGAPAATATDLLVAGKAGALYAGRMEYGPRALGARSILASPADARINDILNQRLARSEFMPFAPYVLAEDAAEVFEITKVNAYAARFMTITCAVKPAWKDRIPAVVHVDGTARPQIVEDATNPLYADILRRFKAATGLPVLVNTSFNVHEEPIVNRPQECLRALLDGRVDFVVTKEAAYVLG